MKRNKNASLLIIAQLNNNTKLFMFTTQKKYETDSNPRGLRFAFVLESCFELTDYDEASAKSASKQTTSNVI